MRTRPFNLVVTLSLLLCVATGVLCLRTLFITDVITMYRGQRYWSVSTDPGAVTLARKEITFEWPGDGNSRFRYYGRWYGVRYPHGKSQTIRYDGNWDLTWAIGSFVHAQRYIIIRLPLWPALVAFAYLPLRTAIRRRGAQWRAKHQFCRACGYDLRVTPDRCPECGAVSEPGGSAAGERDI